MYFMEVSKILSHSNNFQDANKDDKVKQISSILKLEAADLKSANIHSTLQKHAAQLQNAFFQI